MAGGGADRAWSTGSFPLARAEEQPDGLEEERRLCYVGLTRAKDKLYLTWARARRRGGELRPGIPSRFLKALPPGIVEERRTTSLWAPDWTAGQAGAAGSGAVDARTERGRRRQPSTAAPPARRSRRAEESQDAPRYVKGERVRHRRFGSGTIRGLSGAGRDLKVSVVFDDEESRREAAARGLRRPRARMGERMSIGRDEVLHVARLAELAVREEELDRLVEQLNRIVDYVAQLDQVPADRMAEPFLPGPAAARAAGRRARAGAAGPAARRARAGVRATASSWCRGTARWRRR